MPHKAGFVNIIGYPNVGKSTLMNSLVGAKLSIITSKAQTTRHRIMGIVNGENFQVVYSDTPGIVRAPAYEMHKLMNQYVETALIDADVLLLLTEPGLRFGDDAMIQKIQQTNAPIIILINKIDLSDQQGVKEEILFWENRLPGSDVIPISALESFNIDKVFDLLLEKLPESPPYYDKSEFTTRSMRFFVSEIIRGKILLNYRKEIPYSVEVAVDSYKEETQLIRISATIFVDRESQKAIILGHQGKSIKKTATEARKDIEEFVESKVFLEITVKVKKDWRNNEDMLKRFGYDQ